MHDLDLVMTLAGGLAAALAFGYVTQRLGLSPIVGYLLAGIAVGPATPGFVADRAMAEQLAELGSILLMFGVGLPFHLEGPGGAAHQLRAAGVKAFYGDATLQAILEQAGVGATGTFVLSVSGFRGAEEVIRLARGIHPRIHILARTRYLADIPAVRRAGATRFFRTGEVALAMTESVLVDLGTTPEQIDRQRAQVHNDLFSWENNLRGCQCSVGASADVGYNCFRAFTQWTITSGWCGYRRLAPRSAIAC